ncbi:hypothetical protein QVD17_22998 [Tagetes erecta]|uniref:Uncharacterized protein n=1 Tax=Tagetes erecta TaxID=13708 RepID=A0AAD8KE32_TARER|nr:hypothetical protein QVD17_22998 [Tagetes erecta]
MHSLILMVAPFGPSSPLKTFRIIILKFYFFSFKLGFEWKKQLQGPICVLKANIEDQDSVFEPAIGDDG